MTDAVAERSGDEEGGQDFEKGVERCRRARRFGRPRRMLERYSMSLFLPDVASTHAVIQLYDGRSLIRKV